MLQIQEEGVHTYGYVHSEYWDIYKRGVLRKNGIRYRSFPQRVATVVVSALGDHELPDSDVEQLRLITQWIAAIPDEKQIGGNNDFGGKYAGLTFPSCEPGRNIKIEPGMSVEFIAYVMDCDEVEYRVHGEGFVILNMDEDDARRYVDENFSQV